MLEHEGGLHEAELLGGGFASEEGSAGEEDLEIDEVELEGDVREVGCLEEEAGSFESELQTGLGLCSPALGVATALEDSCVCVFGGVFVWDAIELAELLGDVEEEKAPGDNGVVGVAVGSGTGDLEVGGAAEEEVEIGIEVVELEAKGGGEGRRVRGRDGGLLGTNEGGGVDAREEGVGLVMAVLEDEVGGELKAVDVGEAWLLEEGEDEVDVGLAELSVEDIALVIGTDLVDTGVDEWVEVKEALSEVSPCD